MTAGEACPGAPHRFGISGRMTTSALYTIIMAGAAGTALALFILLTMIVLRDRRDY